jgi:hypothetical protein
MAILPEPKRIAAGAGLATAPIMLWYSVELFHYPPSLPYRAAAGIGLSVLSFPTASLQQAFALFIRSINRDSLAKFVN